MDNCYIFLTFLLIAILLLITTVCYYCLKYLTSFGLTKKTYYRINNIKMQVNIKNHTSYYFDDTMNINDLDPDNILLDEKTHENI